MNPELQFHVIWYHEKSRVLWFVSTASIYCHTNTVPMGVLIKWKLLITINYMINLDDILISCNYFWVTMSIWYLYVLQVQTIWCKNSGQISIIIIINLFKKVCDGRELHPQLGEQLHALLSMKGRAKLPCWIPSVGSW